MRRVLLPISITVLVLSVAWFLVSPSYEPAITGLGAVFGLIQLRQREDESVLTVKNRKRVTNRWESIRYSFCRPDYIHPFVIKDLLGWMSDGGELVVCVNLLDANESNRYYGTFDVDGIGRPWVSAKTDGESIAYRLIGTSRSGIHVLHVVSSGRGSGIFSDLMLVTLEEDEGIVARGGRLLEKPRLLLNHLGTIALGDRFSGEIVFDGTHVRIVKGPEPSTAGMDGLRFRVQ